MSTRVKRPKERSEALRGLIFFCFIFAYFQGFSKEKLKNRKRTLASRALTVAPHPVPRTTVTYDFLNAVGKSLINARLQTNNKNRKRTKGTHTWAQRIGSEPRITIVNNSPFVNESIMKKFSRFMKTRVKIMEHPGPCLLEVPKCHSVKNMSK